MHRQEACPSAGGDQLDYLSLICLVACHEAPHLLNGQLDLHSIQFWGMLDLFIKLKGTKNVHISVTTV